MKKILIVDKSFVVGGIQTALINMVKELKKYYAVDVLMLYDKGVLKKHFPDDVKIINPCFLMRIHGMSLADAKEEGKLVYFIRFLTGLFDKCFTNRFSIWFAMLFQKKIEGYDAAIAFHHEDSPKATVSGFYRLVSRKTDAPIKLGWIHYDPKHISYNDVKNETDMLAMDKIICVSKGTKDNFLKYHPILSDKCDYCYNFHDIERVLRLKKESPAVLFDKTKFNCFSACRLTRQKAIPRAIKAFSSVLKSHEDVVWYIAGDGEDRKECEELIRENNLEDRIILLGSVDNPFAYMVQSDLYIQPSIYEAAPMVYGEALICKVPIFTTQNISSSEMVDPKYGFICENSKEGIENGLMFLLNNRSLIDEYTNNLKDYEYANDASVRKIEQFLNVCD